MVFIILGQFAAIFGVTDQLPYIIQGILKISGHGSVEECSTSSATEQSHRLLTMKTDTEGAT